MLTKRLSTIFSQSTARVKAISFHPQKPVFITGLHNGSIKAWDYQSNALMHEFNDHDGSVRAITFHPQGDFFISAGDDKVIRLWDYTKRSLSKKFKGHTDFIRSLDFHPTKPWFVSSSDDQTIRIWNFMTGKCLASATGHSHYIMAVKFINENTLISGSLDQSLRVWSCEGLIDNTKKSTFVPSVIIKQILSGHERGINSIFVKDNTIVSGGDDREVKIWEFNGHELEERDSFFNHQGCVTSVSYNDQCVVSGGEDGQIVVYNLERKQYEKFSVEGRVWTVAQKNNLIIAGHDSGYEIFRYDTPMMVCKSEMGYFYTKDKSIFYSDLKTEKKVCDPNGVLISMHSIGNILLLQFKSHFEVFRKNKCILKEQAEGVLVKIKGQVNVVVREKTDFYMIDLNGSIVKNLDNTPGSLLFGDEDFFFIRRNLNLARVSSDGDEFLISLGFKVDQIICCNSIYALISKNDVHLYDTNMNFINGTKEVVNIHDGFFYDDVFIYATSKHIKYIFREDGVIRSIDTEVYPFHFSQGQILYLSNEGFESIDVDLTEIDFKKLVLKGESVNSLIEEGKLPGLSPLSFLIKNHKGEIALPYIEDKRQRFELSLGDNRLEECLEYCREEKDHFMYKRLSLVALQECQYEIAEECFIFLEEWHDLFMLYALSGRDEKLNALFEMADDQTKNMIKLYQEDSLFFGFLNDNKEDDSNSSTEEESHDIGYDEEKNSGASSDGVNEGVNSEEANSESVNSENIINEEIRSDGIVKDANNENTYSEEVTHEDTIKDTKTQDEDEDANYDDMLKSSDEDGL